MTDGKPRLTLGQLQMLLATATLSASSRFTGALDHDAFDPPPAPPAPDVPEVVAWYRQREAERKARKRRR